MKILTAALAITVLLHSLREPLPKENGLIVTYKINFRHSKSKPYRSTYKGKLFVTNSRSVFLDEKLAKWLEIDEKMPPGQEKANERMALGSPTVTYIIEKDPGLRYTYFIHEHLKKEHIAYEEPLMSSDLWDILPDTSTVTGLLSYKATCTFGGRHWTAWFSPEIPVSDGPYKFAGLPGLIVKLDSEDGDYNFILSGMEKLNEPAGIPKVPNYELVPKKKFFKLREISANPVLMMESNGGILGGVKLNGKVLTREEWILHLNKDIADKNSIEK